MRFVARFFHSILDGLARAIGVSADFEYESHAISETHPRLDRHKKARVIFGGLPTDDEDD